MNNNTFQPKAYEPPRVETIVVAIEQGIATTTENVGKTNPDLGWD